MPIQFIREYPCGTEGKAVLTRTSTQATQEIKDQHLSPRDRPSEAALELLHANPLDSINLVPSFRDLVPEEVEKEMNRGGEFTAVSEQARNTLINNLMDIAQVLRQNSEFIAKLHVSLKRGSTGFEPFEFRHAGEVFIARPTREGGNRKDFVIQQKGDEEKNALDGAVHLEAWVVPGRSPYFQEISTFGGSDHRMTITLTLNSLSRESFESSSLKAEVYERDRAGVVGN
ncbi:MAG: hypothetical protein OXU45_01285 [Candidatus Melainabacteria bacterium]|nr:hypothetical protein [Candidatus Melainabacteria bacterium]